jgi:hypothetical protein
MCVAKNFAYQEMRFVVARLVLTFNMSLPDSFDVEGFRDGILNIRTTVLEKPLMARATTRPDLNIDTFL